MISIYLKKFGKKSSKLNTNKEGKIIKIEADINEHFLMYDFWSPKISWKEWLIINKLAKLSNKKGEMKNETSLYILQTFNSINIMLWTSLWQYIRWFIWNWQFGWNWQKIKVPNLHEMEKPLEEHNLKIWGILQESKKKLYL